jgi:hypothetical protein
MGYFMTLYKLQRFKMDLKGVIMRDKLNVTREKIITAYLKTFSDSLLEILKKTTNVIRVVGAVSKQLKFRSFTLI